MSCQMECLNACWSRARLSPPSTTITLSALRVIMVPPFAKTALQGLSGACSHQACRGCVSGPVPLSCTSFGDIAATMCGGAIDRALLPEGNSLFGHVAIISCIPPCLVVHSRMTNSKAMAMEQRILVALILRDKVLLLVNLLDMDDANFGGVQVRSMSGKKLLGRAFSFTADLFSQGRCLQRIQHGDTRAFRKQAARSMERPRPSYHREALGRTGSTIPRNCLDVMMNLLGRFLKRIDFQVLSSLPVPQSKDVTDGLGCLKNLGGVSFFISGTVRIEGRYRVIVAIQANPHYLRNGKGNRHRGLADTQSGPSRCVFHYSCLIVRPPLHSRGCGYLSVHCRDICFAAVLLVDYLQLLVLSTQVFTLHSR